jgi:hypothetical protein
MAVRKGKTDAVKSIEEKLMNDDLGNVLEQYILGDEEAGSHYFDIVKKLNEDELRLFRLGALTAGRSNSSTKKKAIEGLLKKGKYGSGELKKIFMILPFLTERELEMQMKNRNQVALVRILSANLLSAIRNGKYNEVKEYFNKIMPTISYKMVDSEQKINLNIISNNTYGSDILDKI